MITVNSYCLGIPCVHFIYGFSAVMQIPWNFYLDLIQVMIKWSQRNFAHDTTTMLSIVLWRYNYSSRSYAQCWFGYPCWLKKTLAQIVYKINHSDLDTAHIKMLWIDIFAGFHALFDFLRRAILLCWYPILRNTAGRTEKLSCVAVNI